MVTVIETVVTGSVMKTVTVTVTESDIDTVNTKIHGYISRRQSKQFVHADILHRKVTVVITGGHCGQIHIIPGPYLYLTCSIPMS